MKGVERATNWLFAYFEGHTAEGDCCERALEMGVASFLNSVAGVWNTQVEESSHQVTLARPVLASTKAASNNPAIGLRVLIIRPASFSSTVESGI